MFILLEIWIVLHKISPKRLKFAYQTHFTGTSSIFLEKAAVHLASFTLHQTPLDALFASSEGCFPPHLVGVTWKRIVLYTWKLLYISHCRSLYSKIFVVIGHLRATYTKKTNLIRRTSNKTLNLLMNEILRLIKH